MRVSPGTAIAANVVGLYAESLLALFSLHPVYSQPTVLDTPSGFLVFVSAFRLWPAWSLQQSCFQASSPQELFVDVWYRQHVGLKLFSAATPGTPKTSRSVKRPSPIF